MADENVAWLTGATFLGSYLGKYRVPGQLTLHSETQCQTLKLICICKSNLDGAHHRLNAALTPKQ